MTTTGCYYTRRMLVTSLGCLVFGFGVFLHLNWIDMFTRLRGKEMALSPTSRSYAGWKSSPLPLNFDVYLFNWTNPEDFYQGSAKKPHFVQLGPYRFRDKPDKVQIEWHSHNDSVSFRKQNYFYFDAAGSNGTLQDKITTVNVVAHETAKRAAKASFIAKKLVQRTLSIYNEDVAVTRTANEFLFAGYRDPLLTIGKVVSSFMAAKPGAVKDRLGWLYSRNGSTDFNGHINVHTGADDIYKLGQIHTWNYKTHNGIYEGDCGRVHGSTGEFFPPNLSTNDSIHIYLPKMCRTVPLDYTETVKVHGVTAYRFSGTRRAVDNGTLFPEAKCFCVNGKCRPSGVINVGPCQQNSSAFMSYPHFYQADPYYLSMVDGLRPEKDKHEFFMSLEPNAGVVMDVGGGFQFNFLTEPVSGIQPFENIPSVFMPIMWCEERVRLTPEIAENVALVPFMVLMGQVLAGIMLASGAMLICWYPAKYVSQCWRDPKQKTALLNPLTTSILMANVAPQYGKPSENHTLLKQGGAEPKITQSLIDETAVLTPLKQATDR